MKKFLLLAALALSFSAEVKAWDYRAAFQTTPQTCWAGGTCYPNGICGGWTVINTNTTCYMYPGTVCYGYMICDIYKSCCGYNVTIGSTWAEISFNGGATWFTVANTFRWLTFPGGTEAEFDVGSTGVLDNGHVRIQCNGAGGGW